MYRWIVSAFLGKKNIKIDANKRDARARAPVLADIGGYLRQILFFAIAIKKGHRL
jgi:hypothetical protein